jgi:hypothetical protein
MSGAGKRTEPSKEKRLRCLHLFGSHVRRYLRSDPVNHFEVNSKIKAPLNIIDSL